LENQYAEKQDDESREPEPSAVELPHTIPSDTRQGAREPGDRARPRGGRTKHDRDSASNHTRHNRLKAQAEGPAASPSG
jgi:hypothetical protein